jgi:hypothetical protein
MQGTDPQKLARITGWLFIGTIVFSIPGALLYAPLLDHKDFILGHGSETQIALGACLEILTVICNIGTSLALFPVLKRESESLALGYVAIRILEGTLIVVGIVSLLTVVTLRDDLAGGSTSAASLVLTGQTLKDFHDMTFLLGPSFCAAIGNGILLGYLMYRSGLVPRRLAMLGLIGGPLCLLAGLGVLFDVYDQNSTPQGLLTAVEFIWELSLGIYLIVRGFTPAGLERLGFTSRGGRESLQPSPAV